METTRMNQSVRLAIHGAAGRMGRALVQSTLSVAGVGLSAAVDRADSPDQSKDAAVLAGQAASGVLITSTLEAAAFDVVIDFTRPEGSLAALDYCLRHHKAIVIGTTGFSDDQRHAIERAAAQIPVCMSGNFSIGVNLCEQLVELAARALGESFDIEIVESHHRHKVDAPSGTALMLGQAAAKGAGRNLAECAVYERYGHTGARDARTIGFSTVRGGDVVGDHTVMFLGDGERVEITHKASNRMNFANGAVRAARWLAGRTPGLYSMRDVLSG